jgi:hypothetical protein
MRFDHVATDPGSSGCEKRNKLGKAHASYHIKAVVRGQRWQGYGLDSAEMKSAAAVAGCQGFFWVFPTKG